MTPTPDRLTRWPEADLFAALDAEGWFRGMDTEEASAAVSKVYARLATAEPKEDDQTAADWNAAVTDPERDKMTTKEWWQRALDNRATDIHAEYIANEFAAALATRPEPGDGPPDFAAILRQADASMRDETGRNRSRTTYYWRDLAAAIYAVWDQGHSDLRSGLTEGGTDLAHAIEAKMPALADRPEPGELERYRAALKRLDAIARVDPRNEVGEAEFTDALAQSFTALHPDVRPVWKRREAR